MIRMDSLDVRKFYAIGDSLIGTGLPEEAIKYFDAMIQRDRDNANAFHFRAFAYARLDKHERALEDYQESIRLDPENKYTYLNRVTSLFNLERYDSAIKDLDTVIDLDPTSALAFRRRAYALPEIGRNRESIKHYKKALKLEPDPVTYHNLGQILADMGKFRKAIENFDQAILMDSTEHSVYQDRSAAYKELGKLDHARKDSIKAGTLQNGQ